jgi:fatty acid desaturase
MSSVNFRDYLSKEDLAELRTSNDMRAAWMFVFNWLVIAGCFAVFASSLHWTFTIVALFVLGGRQLGLGILLHECSHQAFFSSVRLNRLVGHWFAGMPMLIPFDFYRPYHLKHHAKTGTKEDPDLPHIEQYPVSKASFLRKVVRDFTGLSGIKMLYGMLFFVLPGRQGSTVSLGTNEEDGAYNQSALKNYSQVALFHGAAFALFYALGQPLLYACWWVAFIFFYPFIVRLRQIAEHGAMPSFASDDVRDTTRTTIARWWERALFAPNFVNYHCEHHFLPTVPSYNLPKMHRLLRDRGFYQGKGAALVSEGGYFEIARLAASD